jgi:hypothetical protein
MHVPLLPLSPISRPRSDCLRRSEPAFSNMVRPSSWFVPTSLITSGTFKSSSFRAMSRPLAMSSQRVDSAEDIDEYRLDFGIPQNNFQGVGHLLRIGAAAHIQEIGRISAVVFDNVHCGHGQAGAVHHAPDIAIQADKTQIFFSGFDFIPTPLPPDYAARRFPDAGRGHCRQNSPCRPRPASGRPV